MKNFRLAYSEKEIKKAAEQFLAITKGVKHLAFYGEMGSGKTTFITALCHCLNSIDLVSSPTFSIINEYSTQTGEIIYHFDFYRIKTTVELYDIGFYDYCTEEAYCFIEWPDKAEEIIPDDFLSINIKEQEDGSRVLTFTL